MGRVIRVDEGCHRPHVEGPRVRKGLAAVQALYNPNRMKYPMKRVGERGTNQWERISWKEAIDTIADALWEGDEKGDSMQLVTSTGGGGNPQFFSAIRFAGVNQSNFFEPGCAQCYLPRNHAQPAINGTSCDNSIADSDAQEIYFEDNETQTLVLWGTDPSQSCPASGGRAIANLRARGTKTIVIDPRFTPDATKADVWLPVRARTDVALTSVVWFGNHQSRNRATTRTSACTGRTSPTSSTRRRSSRSAQATWASAARTSTWCGTRTPTPRRPCRIRGTTA